MIPSEAAMVLQRRRTVAHCRGRGCHSEPPPGAATGTTRTGGVRNLVVAVVPTLPRMPLLLLPA